MRDSGATAPDRAPLRGLGPAPPPVGQDGRNRGGGFDQRCIAALRQRPMHQDARRRRRPWARLPLEPLLRELLQAVEERRVRLLPPLPDWGQGAIIHHAPGGRIVVRRPRPLPRWGTVRSDRRSPPGNPKGPWREAAPALNQP